VGASREEVVAAYSNQVAADPEVVADMYVSTADNGPYGELDNDIETQKKVFRRSEFLASCVGVVGSAGMAAFALLAVARRTRMNTGYQTS